MPYDARRMTDRVDFPLAPPPRAVPLATRLRVFFGGFLNQFGWIFFGFGLIFFWVFALNADLASFLRFRGALETTPGVIVESEETGASENDVRIYKHQYAFQWNGADYTGVSYARGHQVEPGAQVTVEFARGDPSVSRIQGMRRTMFGPWAIFVVIFPLIGLVFILVSVRGNLRAARLLAQGQLTTGTLVTIEPTSTRIKPATSAAAAG